MWADAEELGAFLERSGWGGAAREPLAGDASRRRYERISQGDHKAVLMIAAPETGEDARKFVRAARHLRALGYSAPEILAADISRGLLMIEDLGDDLFARIADRHAELEPAMYCAAVDVLLHLHEQPVPDWAAPYSSDMLAEFTLPAFEWYGSSEGYSSVHGEFQALFALTTGLTDVLILRDFHAENLVWLPEREGLARAGLLDFQDAMAGHRAFDLVSLVEDARRDLAPGLGEDLIDLYISRSGVAADEFRRAYALLGAQRNLRILGVFARLAIRDGKPGYLRLLPRVWHHLIHDLSHPELERLCALILAALPKPDERHINSLVSRCSPTH